MTHAAPGQFETRYGRFIDRGDAYEVTRADAPTPWCNVISNGRYGLVVSHRGGGFSWLDNSQLNVITRWDMDLIRDALGRFLYVSDLDRNEIWSLAPAPCNKPLDAYACRHAPGWTRFECARLDIETSWTLSTAAEDTAELWAVSITNRSRAPRRLRLAAYLEWCLGVAPDAKRTFHQLFITTRHEAARRAILAQKNMWDIPDRTEKDHWNRPWPYAAGVAVSDSFEGPLLATGDKDAFLGRYGDTARPMALLGADAPIQRFGRSGDAIAALGGDLVLKPGETRDISLALAVSEREDETIRLLDRYATPDRVTTEIQSNAARWRSRLEPVRVETSSSDFDAMNNTWLPYQAISARLWGRTGYYQQSGAFGFRDQLQDSNVWLPRDPARTREQILLHAAQQFEDGSVYHWWHPLGEFGLRTSCSDDYLWLPFLTCRYVKETGDRSILSERVAFVDNQEGATLLEHAQRSIDRAFSRVSDRGLPLIGSCDWNDGLSACGVDGRGESVWLAFFLAHVLRDWACLLEREGDPAGSARALAHRERLIADANEHAWDGAWYRRATTDSGRWIGSNECDGGRIYLNPQVWSILADAAPPAREAEAWASVKRRLMRDMGPLLLAPAYETPDDEVGYITRYAPGARENGGVYMHAATWALAAACKRRDSDAAEAIWNSISPPRRGLDADGYAAEPYVTPGNVDGPTAATPGRAGWTWYTGSAAWLHTVSLEWVLGLRAEWDGLLIDPMPWPSLGAVRVERAWRGRTIRVAMDAPPADPNAQSVVRMSGSSLPTRRLTERDAAKGATIEIEVTWAVTPAAVEPKPSEERLAPEGTHR